MGKCARCDLARVYKLFEEKKARQAEEAKKAAEPAVEEKKVAEPVEAPAKKTKKKIVEAPVEEEPAIIENEQSEEE